ncbi:MAG: hypothetical protein ABEI99_10775, partial [Halobaculum sp.]
FLFRVAAEYEIGFVSEPLVEKRYHDNNSSNRSVELLADERAMTADIVDRFPEFRPDASKRKAFLWLLEAKFRVRDGDFTGGVHAYGRAFSTDPVFTLRRTLGFPFRR